MKEIVFNSEVPYNAAFFGLYESVFLLLEKERGTEGALKFMRLLFANKLKTAYDSMGFKKGSAEDFARCVGERDKGVGLKVSFVLDKNNILYRFHTDPFPGLKGKIDPLKFDKTFMDFKINYILGTGWKLVLKKHIRKGDKFTEYSIEKA